MTETVTLTPAQHRVLTVVVEEDGEAYGASIARQLDRERNTIKSHLDSLAAKGLIESVNPGGNPKPYRATREGYMALVSSEHSNTAEDGKIKLRLHKVRIKFQLDAGYDQLADDPDLQQVKIENWTQLWSDTAVTDDRTVTYSVQPESVIFNIPAIPAPPTDDGVAHATLTASELANRAKDVLNAEYPELSFADSGPRLIGQHIAIERHPFAEPLTAAGLDGTLHAGEEVDLVIDESTGVPEVEVEGAEASEQATNLCRNLRYQMATDLEAEIAGLRAELAEVRAMASG